MRRIFCLIVLLLTGYASGDELNPQSFSDYRGRGFHRKQKGDWDGAIADFTKVIELAPSDDAYSNLARVKDLKGDKAGALADFTKAIELNPKGIFAYYQRGCLHYDLHEMTDALEDFRKVSELQPTDDLADYAQVRIWLVRLHLGESDAATGELSKYLGARTRGKPDDWPARILQFLVGQLPEGDFFKAAENTNAQIDQIQHCEAFFYAGASRLFAGDRVGAKDDFEKSLATNLTFWTEYSSAAAELRFLKAAK